MSSVIYRRGLAASDYDEAIQALQEAKRQPGNEAKGCTVCWDSGHTANYCHHNPLVMARRATAAVRVWRCFHCDAVFTDSEKAQEHFGVSGTAAPKCAGKDAVPSVPISCELEVWKNHCGWNWHIKGSTWNLLSLPDEPFRSRSDAQRAAERTAERLNITICKTIVR